MRCRRQNRHATICMAVNWTVMLVLSAFIYRSIVIVVVFKIGPVFVMVFFIRLESIITLVNHITVIVSSMGSTMKIRMFLLSLVYLLCAEF